jgi:hypothetical protein
MEEFDTAYTKAIEKLKDIPNQGYNGEANLKCYASGMCEIWIGDIFVEGFNDIENFLTYMLDEKYFNENI